MASSPTLPDVPKLWTETIEAHRRQVRQAILDTTATLVAEHGLLGVTMSQIAKDTGIGRATLYKYFSGVEEILRVWHQRQIASHLDHLAQIRDRAGGPGQALQAVLEGYAGIHRQRVHHHEQQPHGRALAAFLHRADQLAPAQQHLCDMLAGLLGEAAQAGEVRDDIAPRELATYCLHALNAASTLSSKAAVDRLVQVTLAGLRPPS